MDVIKTATQILCEKLGITLDKYNLNPQTYIDQYVAKYGNLITDANGNTTTLTASTAAASGSGGSSGSGSGSGSSSGSNTKKTSISVKSSTIKIYSVTGSNTVRVEYEKNKKAKSYSVEWQTSKGETTKDGKTTIWYASTTNSTAAATNDYEYEPNTFTAIRARVTPEPSDTSKYEGKASSWVSISMSKLDDQLYYGFLNQPTGINAVKLNNSGNLTVDPVGDYLYIDGISYFEVDYLLVNSSGGGEFGSLLNPPTVEHYPQTWKTAGNWPYKITDINDGLDISTLLGTTTGVNTKKITFYIRRIYEGKVCPTFTTKEYDLNRDHWIDHIATTGIQCTDSKLLKNGQVYSITFDDLGYAYSGYNIKEITASYNIRVLYSYRDYTDSDSGVLQDTYSGTTTFTNNSYTHTVENPTLEFTIPTNVDVERLTFEIQRVSTTSEVTGDIIFYAGWAPLLGPVSVIYPNTPSAPTIKIKRNKLIIESNILDNASKKILYEITIDHDQVIEVGPVDIYNRYASYEYSTEPGHLYSVRARAIGDEGHFSPWSNSSSDVKSRPVGIDDSKFTLEVISRDSVRLRWVDLDTADTYHVQYCKDNKNDLDETLENIQTKTTEFISAGYAQTTIDNLEAGHYWFFRVAVEIDGQISEYSVIKEVLIGGEQPAAPTTWSSTTVGKVGDDITLWWVHNSTDGSAQQNAELVYYISGGGTLTVDDYNIPSGKYPKFINEGIPNIQKTSSKIYSSSDIADMTDDERENLLLEGDYYLDLRHGILYLCESIQYNHETITRLDDLGNPLTPETLYTITGKWKVDSTLTRTTSEGGVNSDQAITKNFDFADSSEVFDGISISNRTDKDVYLEQKGKSYYIIHTSDSLYAQGCNIEWKVRTKGIAEPFSEYSTTRTIKLYPEPSLSLLVSQENNWFWNKLNFNDGSIYSTEGTMGDALDLIDHKFTHYPLYIKANGGVQGQDSLDTSVQYPLSYSVVITALDAYEILDEYGMTEHIHAGQVVYSNNFDINSQLFLPLMPADVQFSNDSRYEVTVTVAMSSGLSATSKTSFAVNLEDIGYIPNADAQYSEEQAVMYVRPYCYYTNLEFLNNTFKMGWFGANNNNIVNESYKYIASIPYKDAIGDYDIEFENASTDDVAFAFAPYTRANTISTNLSSCIATNKNNYIITTKWKPFISIIETEFGEKTYFEYYWSMRMKLYNEDGVMIHSGYINTDIVKMDNISDTNTSKGFITEGGYVTHGYTSCDLTDSYNDMDEISFHVRLTKNGYTYDWHTIGVLNFEEDELVNEIKLTNSEHGSLLVLTKNKPTEDIIVGTINFNGKLVDNALLSVFRRDYDGGFTEIQSEITNTGSTTVVDPHPALDAARYRIVATNTNTYRVNYGDPPAFETDEIGVILQWNEEWTDFNSSLEDVSNAYVKPYNGSLLRIIYNIDVADNYDVDSELVDYIGRKRSVSYYGTHRKHTATWSVEIPKSDRETVYALRRLANYAGDVYVREPYGSGYWANVKVAMNQNHISTIIPVTLTITRVDGGA